MCKKSSQPTNQTTTTLTTTTTIMQQPIASKPAKPHRLNILHPLSITHEILTSRRSDDDHFTNAMKYRNDTFRNSM